MDRSAKRILQIRLEHRRICNSAFSDIINESHATILLCGFRFKAIFEGKFKSWWIKPNYKVGLAGG